MVVPEPTESVTPRRQTAAELTFQTLGTQWQEVLLRTPGALAGEDPEELHKMRVALRRLRAAIRLFREVLPPQWKTTNTELRWLASLLGAVRDLDVQIDRLRAWAEVGHVNPDLVGPLTQELHLRRDRARLVLRRGMESARMHRLTRHMSLKLTRRRATSVGDYPAEMICADLLRREYRRLRVAGGALLPGSEPEAYHQARIRAKRLRYALESFEGIYGKPAKDLAKKVVQIQDLLGEHQDDMVAKEFLSHLSLPGRKRMNPEMAFSLGALAERHVQHAARLRERFPSVLAELEGKSWRKLKGDADRLARKAWRPPAAKSTA